MASPGQRLSKGFYEHISKMRENNEFEDFKVKVDGEIFPCHSFILESYSEFFKCLLRSDMKEKKEMTVELKNISSPTFKLILNSLYTGCKLLTKENVLEVWSAVHQLQINLLIENCENFVIDNVSLDTVDSYKTHADFFQSQKVCEYIFNFILKNFETLRDKEIFFQMDFQYLKRLLESDKLNVSSEDVILYSIFEWVDYTHICVQKSGATNESDDAFINTLQDSDPNKINEVSKKENSSLEANGNAVTEEQNIDSKNPDEPKERKKYLVKLLKSTRYYLASENCISKLYEHNLAQNDILVKDILLQVLMFKLSDHVHGLWPTAAIHRDCSDLEHVGVFCGVRGILALSLKQDKWFSVPKINWLNCSKFTVFKGKLYAYSGITVYNIWALNTNRWELVTDLNNTVQLLLAHEQSIYMLDSIENVFIKFNPDTSPIQLETIGHELQNPEFALSFYDNIIVFCSVDNNGLEKTAVHSWNTKNNEWTLLENLEFSSKHMTSFRNDSDTYILNLNGNLWKLTNTEVIGFTFVAKLWSVKYDVRGAVLLRKTLHIFGESQPYVDMLNEVEGVYSSKRLWNIQHKTSNFIHYVIPKRELAPLKNKYASTDCNIL